MKKASLKLGSVPSGVPDSPSVAETERAVSVEFKLDAGGAAHKYVAKSGQTVEFLKAVAADQFSLPVASLTLLYKGKPMMDPLAIADIDPKASSMAITVKCNLGSKFEQGAADTSLGALAVLLAVFVATQAAALCVLWPQATVTIPDVLVPAVLLTLIAAGLRTEDVEHKFSQAALLCGAVEAVLQVMDAGQHRRGWWGRQAHGQFYLSLVPADLAAMLAGPAPQNTTFLAGVVAAANIVVVGWVCHVFGINRR
eukprot:m51a1_g2050 hypothetical protein (254) ;mRNA; f:1388963-1390439